MSTKTQISANRLNAQKSTGPKTPEGKAKVAQNAVTHGLTAFRPVLANENPEEYTLFRDDFIRRHAPVGILEESLANRAVDSLWRLQRAQDYETAVLNTLIAEARSASDGISSDDPKDLLGQILLDDFRQTHCLEKIQKYEMSIERSYFRTVKELRHLQSLRLNVGEASVLHYNSENSKQNKPNPVQSKPKIPPFDPENIKSNPIDLCGTLPSQSQYSSLAAENRAVPGPIGLDPLTKIMMKKDNFQRLTTKAM